MKWKKDGTFERKYDMSKLGNIYISARHGLPIPRLVSFCAIKLTYKAIYWDARWLTACCFSIEDRRLFRIVTVLSTVLVQANVSLMI
jgi:hypothetical protein